MRHDRSQFTIRRATPADAEPARDLTKRTFAETFGHLYPPEDLAHFFRTVYTPEAFVRLLSSESHALWLLERSGQAIGHALAGPCILPHPDVAPGDGEIQRLYILKEAHNGGWGGRLMRTALDWLERDGPRQLWIGVWSENYCAQRFYGRHGFQQAGEYLFPVGKTNDREFILRRRAHGSLPPSTGRPTRSGGWGEELGVVVSKKNVVEPHVIHRVDSLAPSPHPAPKGTDLPARGR